MLRTSTVYEPMTTDSIAAADTEALPLDLEPGRGVYDAARAAALAGVPKTTLHYWARTGLYPPSISPGPRVRLWSWADLLALRAIDWLRRKERTGSSAWPCWCSPCGHAEDPAGDGATDRAGYLTRAVD